MSEFKTKVTHVRYMAMWCDADGLPRAYGVSPDKDDAEAIATIELEEYKATRAPWTYYPPFTLKIERLADDVRWEVQP